MCKHRVGLMPPSFAPAAVRLRRMLEQTSAPTARRHDWRTQKHTPDWCNCVKWVRREAARLMRAEDLGFRSGVECGAHWRRGEAAASSEQGA